MILRKLNLSIVPELAPNFRFVGTNTERKKCSGTCRKHPPKLYFTDADGLDGLCWNCALAVAIAVLRISRHV